MKKIVSKNLKQEHESIYFTKPTSMVSQIHRSLRNSIVAGELKPGQILREIELQKAFSVSRAPIREAIRLLEADGLVIVDAYKKKCVRPISSNYLKDLIPVLALLEGFAAKLASKTLLPNQIDMLKKKNEEMQKAFEGGKVDLCAELNFDFHKSFVKAADNNALNTAIRAISKGIISYWLTNFHYKIPEVIPEAIRGHNRIIKAFVNKDDTLAEEMARKHINDTMIPTLKYALFDTNGFFLESEKIE